MLDSIGRAEAPRRRKLVRSELLANFQKRYTVHAHAHAQFYTHSKKTAYASLQNPSAHQPASHIYPPATPAPFPRYRSLTRPQPSTTNRLPHPHHSFPNPVSETRLPPADTDYSPQSGARKRKKISSLNDAERPKSHSVPSACVPSMRSRPTWRGERKVAFGWKDLNGPGLPPVDKT